jgi:hypothetical protein
LFLPVHDPIRLALDAIGNTLSKPLAKALIAALKAPSGTHPGLKPVIRESERPYQVWLHQQTEGADKKLAAEDSVDASTPGASSSSGQKR